MKNFILENWYRLMTAAAMLIFATAMLIFSVTNNVARAGDANSKTFDPTPSGVWMVVKNNKVYEVSWNKYKKEYTCTLACDN